MKFIITSICLLFFVIFIVSTNAYAQVKNEKTGKQMPHIVLIVADDLGYGDLGINGATKISTPAIDKIANEGINFVNAYASSSLCSPSRYTLMTGRYSWRTQLKQGVLTYYDPPLIKPEQTTVAGMLKRNGYQTVLIGKWHLGFDWILKDSAIRKDKRDFVDFNLPGKGGPLDRGFDYFYGINGAHNMLPHAYIENDRMSGKLTEKEKSYDHYGFGLKSPDWEIENVNIKLTHKAVDAIDKHFRQPNNKPLFLYFAATAIHDPCLPTFTKGKSRAGIRGDVVQELDWTVQQIINALKKNGVYDNTLLIFTSDNGPRPGDPAYWIKQYSETKGYTDYHEPYFDNFKAEYKIAGGDKVSKEGYLTYDHQPSGKYRGFKGDAWEGGFRVPFIVRWNKINKPGSISKSMLCQGDLFATLSELVGDDLKSSEAEDSYSFLQNITGQSNDQARKTMVVSSGGNGAMVVYKDGWKYIEGANGSSTYYPQGPFQQDAQLYNLQRDPFENNNLFQKMPEKTVELKAEIIKVTNHTIREAD